MEFITDWLDWFSDFFTGDGDEPSIWEHAMAWITIWWFKIKIAALASFWGVAEAVIDQLNISGSLNSAWASIDSELMGYLTFFRIPEALNIILQARITRFILDMWA